MSGLRARCKFRVSEVKQHRTYTAEDKEAGRDYGEATGPVTGEEIKLWTEYDENDPEDTKFSAATPSGSMEFNLSNPALLDRFKQGQSYYVTLEEVE